MGAVSVQLDMRRTERRGREDLRFRLTRAVAMSKCPRFCPHLRSSTVGWDLRSSRLPVVMLNLAIDLTPAPDGGAFNLVRMACLTRGAVPCPRVVGLVADVLETREACQVVGGAVVARVRDCAGCQRQRARTCLAVSRSDTETSAKRFGISRLASQWPSELVCLSQHRHHSTLHSLVDVDEHTLVGLGVESKLAEQLRALRRGETVDRRNTGHLQVAPVVAWVEVCAGEPWERLVECVVLV